MSITASGHKVEHLEDDELKSREKDFNGYQGMKLVRLNPGRWLYLEPFVSLADKIYNFKVKPSDVFIVTWPKCGTTWTQEIVWTMRNNPNLDNPMGDMPVNSRVPFIESEMFFHSRYLKPLGPGHPLVEAFNKLCPGKNPADGISVQISAAMPEPRTIKSHLTFSLLPPDITKTAKAVYVARNPKDVVISYHHHSKMFKSSSYKGTFEDFVQYFVDDDLLYGPYWLHLKEGWSKRQEPNVHFIFYEDLKSNNLEELRKLNAFLGTNLTDEQLKKISHYTSFDQMKARDNLVDVKDPTDLLNVEVVDNEGGFFRKGAVGDWKGKYTPELEAKVNEWCKKNLQDFGINFKYAG